MQHVAGCMCKECRPQVHPGQPLCPDCRTPMLFRLAITTTLAITEGWYCPNCAHIGTD